MRAAGTSNDKSAAENIAPADSARNLNVSWELARRFDTRTPKAPSPVAPPANNAACKACAALDSNCNHAANKPEPTLCRTTAKPTMLMDKPHKKRSGLVLARSLIRRMTWLMALPHQKIDSPGLGGRAHPF